MSEDFTQKLPKNGHDREILTAIKDLDTKVTRIDNRVQSLEQKFDGLERKVDGLDKKVDERLHDTRPIWHKVVADIAELQSGQKHLEDGQKHLEEGQKRLEEGQRTMSHVISELSSTVHNLNRDQIVMHDSYRRIQQDFLTLNEKLLKVIVDRNQQNSST